MLILLLLFIIHRVLRTMVSHYLRSCAKKMAHRKLLIEAFFSLSELFTTFTGFLAQSSIKVRENVAIPTKSGVPICVPLLCQKPVFPFQSPIFYALVTILCAKSGTKPPKLTHFVRTCDHYLRTCDHYLRTFGP